MGRTGSDKHSTGDDDGDPAEGKAGGQRVMKLLMPSAAMMNPLIAPSAQAGGGRPEIAQSGSCIFRNMTDNMPPTA